MEFIEKELTKIEITKLRRKYGDYVKLTVDVNKEWVVVAPL